MVDGILVTGGAGYIGSHVVKQLTANGEHVVVLDNLSTGFADAVRDADLVVGDIADTGLVAELLATHNVKSVMHFAAHTIVPESVSDPLKYYANNTCGALSLLRACAAQGVAHFVFSSTAAVYGLPAGGRATEQSPTAPINPYGTSKLMAEWMLRDLAAAGGIRHTTLRYFNVAGSDPDGDIGQCTENATLLIKVACETAVGKRPQLTLFGTDYATPDGTCIRDFIHVHDLATVDLLALGYLRSGGESITLNCGYGRGYSVREVIAAVEKVHGSQLPVVESARRPGDPPELVADTSLLQQLFNWQPRYADLDTIVATSLRWEQHLLAIAQPRARPAC